MCYHSWRDLTAPRLRLDCPADPFPTLGFLLTGDAESNALLKEINNKRPQRPLTHDTAKNLLQATGFRVTKVRRAVWGGG